MAVQARRSRHQPDHIICGGRDADGRLCNYLLGTITTLPNGPPSDFERQVFLAPEFAPDRSDRVWKASKHALNRRGVRGQARAPRRRPPIGASNPTLPAIVICPQCYVENEISWGGLGSSQVFSNKA